MAWTYNTSLSTDKDKVRMHIGDVDTNEQLVADETIQSILDDGNSVYLAAAIVAEGIAAVFARKVDFTSGDESVKLSQMSQNYMKKAETLRSRAGKAYVSPYLGGISQAQKDASADDDDLIQPAFRKGMFDNGAINDEDCKC